MACFLLEDKIFQSMFVSSLEGMKYRFISSILTLFKENQKTLDIVNKDPYKDYVKNIQKGKTGEEFTKKTEEYY